MHKTNPFFDLSLKFCSGRKEFQIAEVSLPLKDQEKAKEIMSAAAEEKIQQLEKAYLEGTLTEQDLATRRSEIRECCDHLDRLVNETAISNRVKVKSLEELSGGRLTLDY